MHLQSSTPDSVRSPAPQIAPRSTARLVPTVPALERAPTRPTQDRPGGTTRPQPLATPTATATNPTANRLGGTTGEGTPTSAHLERTTAAVDRTPRPDTTSATTGDRRGGAAGVAVGTGRPGVIAGKGLRTGIDLAVAVGTEQGKKMAREGDTIEGMPCFPWLPVDRDLQVLGR